MPRGDRTGPLGEGRMTGRRQGRCVGNDARDFSFGYGAGFGRRGRGNGAFGGGRGMGRGRGLGYGAGSGFRTSFQRAAYEDEGRQDILPESGAERTSINQQLARVIDQLSRLLDKTSESRGTDREGK